MILFFFYFTLAVQSRVVSQINSLLKCVSPVGRTAGCIWQCGCLRPFRGPSSEMQSHLSKRVTLFNWHRHQRFKGNISFQGPWGEMGRERHQHHKYRDHNLCHLKKKKKNHFYSLQFFLGEKNNLKRSKKLPRYSSSCSTLLSRWF